MSDNLHQKIQALREHLHEHDQLDPEKRQSIEALIERLELALKNEGEQLAPDELSASVKFAAERFEAEHPTTANVLRSLAQALLGMGI